MTMHLVHPMLSMNGKRKGKRKFRNAEAARQARINQENWDKLKQQWNAGDKVSKSKPFTVWKPSALQFRGSDEPKLPSLEFTGGVCAKPQEKVYTGGNIKGIGTMHKSNAVPIFTDDEAKDIARMRR